MNHPANIFIIRHGEKPGEAHVEGPNDDPNLSVVGHTRAHGLGLNQPFPKPAHFVFATKKTKGSVRPIETIEPYAINIGLTVKSKWADDEYSELAKRLLSKKKYWDKTIVISWHHGKIPALIKALGGDITVAPMISIEGKWEWEANVFDRIIHLEFTSAKKEKNSPVVKTTSIPQRLLFGDSDT